MLEKIYKKLLTILGDIKIFRWPMFLLYHPEGYGVNGTEARHISSVVEPGDILLRGYRNYLDSYFIPGTFSHAGYYLGDYLGKPNRVVHAVAEGVIEEDILQFCRCDYMAVLRIKHLTPYDIMRSKIRAKKYIGKSYDFFFDFDNAADVSCTELVNLIWGRRCGVKAKCHKVLFGLFDKIIIIADDYVRSKATEIIHMSPVVRNKFK